jgi:hypothetical protein
MKLSCLQENGLNEDHHVKQNKPDPSGADGSRL